MEGEWSPRGSSSAGSPPLAPPPSLLGRDGVWGVCAPALPAQGQPHDKDSGPLALGGFLGAVAHADPSAWKSRVPPSLLR